MPNHQLLVLDLHSPLPYEGVENPPLTGAPIEGAFPMPLRSGTLREVGIGLALAEGEEEIFLFEEGELIAFDPDDGPRIKPTLPSPGFYGRGVPRGATRNQGVNPSGDQSERGTGAPPFPRDTAARQLPAGRYAFMQWRPGGEEELAEGIEWFAREVWWERSSAEGPYIVRRIREDGKLATQLLRRLK